MGLDRELTIIENSQEDEDNPDNYVYKTEEDLTLSEEELDEEVF